MPTQKRLCCSLWYFTCRKYRLYHLLTYREYLSLQDFSGGQATGMNPSKAVLLGPDRVVKGYPNSHSTVHYMFYSVPVLLEWVCPFMSFYFSGWSIFN